MAGWQRSLDARESRESVHLRWNETPENLGVGLADEHLSESHVLVDSSGKSASRE